jgi:purine-binding chemotaxis protein CheW
VNETFADAARMRGAFDEAFASAVAETPADGDAFLLVRVGGDPFALRVLEIAEVTHVARVVPLPSADPAFAGLTSLRGVMVPVFELAVLLGYPPGAVPGAWLARCRHPEGMVAFAFDAAEGFVRGIAEAAAASTPRGAPELRREVVAVDGTVRPVVHVAALLADVDGRVNSRRRGS